MVREIPQKTVANVLWDIGFCSPGAIKRRASIPKGARSVKKHWDSINIDFLEPYFDSMPNRMQC